MDQEAIISQPYYPVYLSPSLIQPDTRQASLHPNMRNRQTAALDSCFQNLYFLMDFKIGCQGTQSCDLRGPDRRKINRYMQGVAAQSYVRGQQGRDARPQAT